MCRRFVVYTHTIVRDQVFIVGLNIGGTVGQEVVFKAFFLGHIKVSPGEQGVLIMTVLFPEIGAKERIVLYHKSDTLSYTYAPVSRGNI